jgi:hypothetical protein
VRTGDSDTTVYTLANISACSGKAATTVLADPILSTEPLAKWILYGAEIIEESDEACTVSYTILESGLETQHIYRIDKSRWIITNYRRVETYSGGAAYTIIDHLYYYEDMDGIPALVKIAYDGDTTFALGGYEFTNIVLNEELEDSLFQPMAPAVDKGIFNTGLTTVGFNTHPDWFEEFRPDGRMVEATRIGVQNTAGNSILLFRANGDQKQVWTGRWVMVR